MTKAEGGVGHFVKSFCADPHFSSGDARSALCTESRGSHFNTAEMPRVHCMSGRKVLSLFWWCPKKVKRLKWWMNIMLESSDKKDIFKHKNNHTCPACRAQSALSLQFLAAQHKTSKRMRWGDGRSSTDWQTKGKKKLQNLSRWTDWTQRKMMRVDELDRVYCVPSCTRVYCAMKLDQLSGGKKEEKKTYCRGNYCKM